MNNTLKIASRNIFRNVRRSLMTISAIAVGAIALLLFGEFFGQIKAGLQTTFVMQTGHLAIFKRGYFDFGSGNPSAYGIKNYEEIMQTIQADANLKSKINVITPTIRLFGIAGNYDLETSKTFFAAGVIPDDYNKMRKWDQHGLKFEPSWTNAVFTSQDESHGIAGVGIAKILGLCEALKLGDCPKLEILKPKAETSQTRDFGNLGSDDLKSQNLTQGQANARLDLLAGTASGAPNVVSFYVDKAVPQGVKELDDSFIGMNFTLAQKLLYGRDGKNANAVMIQLHQTEDMIPFKKKIEKTFQDHQWDLEVKDLEELAPFYKQAVGMFSSIFAFIAVIMAVIALFTVVNTMSMSVMERINEIGTIRALGVKKTGVSRQFVIEGSLLGLIGATAGIVLGSIIAEIVNRSGLKWLPPGQAQPIPLKVLNHGVGDLIFGIWFGLVIMATLAAYWPARRAAQLKIVDALGHL